MGILTSHNPDTPEGLESWLSVGIRRIPPELPHSTELEPKSPSNPNGFRQSFHAQATLRAPDKPGSPPALKTSLLSLYSTRMNLGAL
jgi:hypothetical protein